MKKKVLFVLHLLAGLTFLNAGLDKFFHYNPVPKDMPEKVIKVGMAFMEIGWLMPLVGSAEIVGSILLIIPRTRALGALILCPVMAGILLANISMAPMGLPIILALMAIIFWGMYENREKYLPLISKTAA